MAQQYQDYRYLITKYREMINANSYKSTIWSPTDEKLLKTIDFTHNLKNNIVLADSTAVELGSPNSKSLCTHMLTFEPNIVKNQIITCGTDITALQRSSQCFLVFLLCEITQMNQQMANVDFRSDRRVNLTHNIPGFMSKSLGNRLWIRINQKLFQKHFSLQLLGQCFYTEYRQKYPEITKMEICIVVDDPELYHLLEPLGIAADVIAGSNRKLRWVEDGIVSCSDLNCSVCEEKSTCDILKEIVIKRRRTE